MIMGVPTILIPREAETCKFSLTLTHFNPPKEHKHFKFPVSFKHFNTLQPLLVNVDMKQDQFHHKNNNYFLYHLPSI